MFKTIIKLLRRFFKRLFNSYNLTDQGGQNMAIVTVEKNRYTVGSLYQWDKNQVLEIRGLSLVSVPEIHFTNDTMDRAIVRQSSMNDAGVITVNVPNSLLQKPYKITAYVCTYEGKSFKSLYKIVIPVEARNKPNDYTFEDTDGEIYSFNALENAVVNALARLDNAVSEVNTKCDDTIASVKTAHDAAVESVNTKCEEAISSIDEKVDEAVKTLEDSGLVSQSQFNQIAGLANTAYGTSGNNKAALDGLTKPTFTINGLTFDKCEYVSGGMFKVNNRVYVNITVNITSDVGAMAAPIITGLPKAFNQAFLDLKSATYDSNGDAWVYESNGVGQIVPRRALVKGEVRHIIGEYFTA
jgi:hypothetical protein